MKRETLRLVLETAASVLFAVCLVKWPVFLFPSSFHGAVPQTEKAHFLHVIRLFGCVAFCLAAQRVVKHFFLWYRYSHCPLPRLTREDGQLLRYTSWDMLANVPALAITSHELQSTDWMRYISDNVYAYAHLFQTVDSDRSSRLYQISGPQDKNNGDQTPAVSGGSVSRHIAARCVSTYPHLPGRAKREGSPICDYYSLAFSNDFIVAAVSDGCSWGQLPYEASLRANKAFVKYLVGHFDREITTTAEVANLLMLAVCKAHEAVMEPSLDVYDVGTTTLVGGVLVPLADRSGRWAFISVSVGDCQCFHFNTRTGDVVPSVKDVAGRPDPRNLSDPGGRLGPSQVHDGGPDLRNFVVSVQECSEGDVFILMSDGVHDNFNPIQRGAIPLDLGILSASSFDDMSSEEVTEMIDRYLVMKVRELFSASLIRNDHYDESSCDGKSRSEASRTKPKGKPQRRIPSASVGACPSASISTSAPDVRVSHHEKMGWGMKLKRGYSDEDVRPNTSNTSNTNSLGPPELDVSRSNSAPTRRRARPPNRRENLDAVVEGEDDGGGGGGNDGGDDDDYGGVDEFDEDIPLKSSFGFPLLAKSTTAMVRRAYLGYDDCDVSPRSEYIHEDGEVKVHVGKLVDRVIDDCVKTTLQTRNFMETHPDSGQPRNIRRYPGKMDHTTCAAFTVPRHPEVMLAKEE
eukprot:TRINITY_DN1579_c0_g1_i1.p1 TRINITY_DN1579_c0_g1~~TRINITY_DN1579_c0_g1_i1.p1  ORF type:complete len:687 (-),score=95.14 TRINITY_DN1579_c0_g1_i1:234-2294(-)